MVKFKAQNKIRVGIVGCGAIGSELANACKTVLSDRFELIAIYDIDKKKAGALAVNSLEDLINKVDLVVEAASSLVSKEVAEKAVERSKNVMVMSVGGLIEAEDLFKKAGKKNARIFIPSGAISGVDGLKAAGFAKIESVTLTTKKPPKGLAGAPYLKEKNIDVYSIKEETTIFEGNAFEAVKVFPKNVNVSCILSLAGIGPKNTRVRVVTSPDFTKNAHEIEITGDFGRIITRTENVPSKNNPRTSRLAILSAMAALNGIAENVRIGT